MSMTLHEKTLDSDFSKIERGDCIIAFSQRELYRIRKIVESASKWKCAIVYGGLPPGMLSLCLTSSSVWSGANGVT